MSYTTIVKLTKLSATN